jgi:lipopolysaccharide/colanic/teichoic acid biosynthesis glycosyltransferase
MSIGHLHLTFDEAVVQRTLFAERVQLGPYMRYGKRCFDLAVAATATFILLPVFLACALAIKLTSRGPVFFRQVRLGYRGEPFRLYKFRTMRVGEAGQLLTAKDDPRITSVGRFLRRWKLDELPQLLNVLRGEMSLVGPRPRVPELLRYVDSSPMMGLKPGITGFSTLHYRNQEDLLHDNAPECDNGEPWFAQKLALENQYAESVSFGTDLRLLFLTALLVYAPGLTNTKPIKVLGITVNPYSRTGQMAVDFLMGSLAMACAFLLSFGGAVPQGYRKEFWILSLIVPAMRILIAHHCGIYRSSWRYVCNTDLLGLTSFYAITSIGLLACNLIAAFNLDWLFLRIPVLLVVLDFLLVAFLTSKARVCRRVLYEICGRCHPPREETIRQVLLVGAGTLGAGVVDALRQYPEIQLLGFVDDEPQKLSTKVNGLQVLGAIPDIGRIASRIRVDEVMVCMPERVVNHVDEVCAPLGIQVTRVLGTRIYLPA